VNKTSFHQTVVFR